jgi:hypothetical protein
VLDANLATDVHLGYDFGDCAVCKPDMITNFPLVESHASPRFSASTRTGLPSLRVITHTMWYQCVQGIRAALSK